jgi:uncharacterized membrane protein YhaH (DUF805 family)
VVDSLVNNERIRNAAYVALAGAGLFALNFGPFDAVLFPIVVFGPLLTGIVMRLREWPWKLGAAAWGLMGVISLVYDWVLYDEDKVFHVVLTVVMVGLTALGAVIGGKLRPRRSFPHTT